MTARPRYPDAVDPQLVGTYPARAFAGGGYVWDEVLEYRVWCSPAAGAPDLHAGDDYYRAFATYAEALRWSRSQPGAEVPLGSVPSSGGEWLARPPGRATR
jgi:hypothetical protein